MTKTWKGKVPASCDVCKAPIVNEFFDTRTRTSRWGSLCRSCWSAEHGKTGAGYAQHYKQNGAVWEKVEAAKPVDPNAWAFKNGLESY
jgi:hypothetical protein